MREILFRGKTPGGKWVYGDHIKDRIQTDGKPNEYIMIRFFNVFEGENFEDYEFIIPETLGQYTGLKDKNGKMIFECDIIECEMIFESGRLPHAGEVIFHNRFGAFATKNLGGITLLHNHLLNTFEIIGNIHDNPELLK